MRRINVLPRKAELDGAMDAEFDILAIARWAVASYGAEAVPIIRRRAAENLMADEPEAADCWRRVADAASRFLRGRVLH